jgi:hypothetical protein
VAAELLISVSELLSALLALAITIIEWVTLIFSPKENPILLPIISKLKSSFKKGSDMETLTETNSESLVPIKEYAIGKGISPRTVRRRAAQGNITTRKVKGRTMVLDLPIAEGPITPNLSGYDKPLEPRTSQLATAPDNHLFRLGELTALAKNRHRWQALASALIVMLFLAALGGVWLYMTWQTTSESLLTSEASHTELADMLTINQIKIKTLQAELSAAKGQATILTAELAAAKTISSNLQTSLDQIRNDLAALRQQANSQENLTTQITAIGQRLEVPVDATEPSME